MRRSVCTRYCVVHECWGWRLWWWVGVVGWDVCGVCVCVWRWRRGRGRAVWLCGVVVCVWGGWRGRSVFSLPSNLFSDVDIAQTPRSSFVRFTNHIAAPITQQSMCTISAPNATALSPTRRDPICCLRPVVNRDDIAIAPRVSAIVYCVAMSAYHISSDKQHA